MEQKYRAIRNISLCTKDCLCLYVCPTGASNTETGQIDETKCIGCGSCISACPSHAISFVPLLMPAQQKKDNRVINSLNEILKNKSELELMYLLEKENANDEISKQIYESLAMSNNRMGEDIAREAGYMLPQSKISNNLLDFITKTCEDEDMKTKIKELKTLIELND